MTGVRRTRLRAWGVFLATAVGICALTSATAAQTASAAALKAAYLLNFVRFTEWPAPSLPPGGTLTLCVVNDRAVADGLADLVKGRLVDGHRLVVSTPKADAAALASCHLVFASGLDAKGTGALLASVSGKPVLSVSDLDRFAQRGGVAHFFVEHGTFRFAINLDAAQRAGIRLSAKLLSLAKIVKEDADAGR